MKRIAMAVLTLALGLGATLGALAITEVSAVAPAGANGPQCVGAPTVPYPAATIFGIQGVASCSQGTGVWQIIQVCTEVYTPYGWLVDQNGNNAWGTACNNYNEGTQIGEESFGKVQPGTYEYRTYAQWQNVGTIPPGSVQSFFTYPAVPFTG